MNPRIDKARALGYSDAETARRIGVTRSYLCHVAEGRRMLSPECAALLAELVGDDAREALCEQIVEGAREGLRERLRVALFKSRERGAASLGGLRSLAVALATMFRLSTGARAF